MSFLQYSQEQAIRKAEASELDVSTIWMTGRKNKIVAAHDSYQTLTQSDFNNGEGPLMMSRKSAGIRIVISDTDKQQVSGNISHNQWAAIRDAWLSILPTVLKYEQTGGTNAGSEDDPTETKIPFVPGFANLKGKSAKEIVQSVDQNDFKSIITGYQQNSQYDNSRNIALLKLAWNAKSAQAMKFADGKSFAEILLSGTADSYVNDPMYRMYGLFIQSAKEDDRITSVLKNWTGSSGSVSADGPSLVTLYKATKTPNNTNVDKDGNVRIYTISITVDPRKQPYPVKISISDDRCKPADGKTVGAKGNTIIHGTSNEFALSRFEFSDLLDSVRNLVMLKNMRYALNYGALDLNDTLRAKASAYRAANNKH